MFSHFSSLFLLTAALSADAFTAGLSYGSDGVKIPLVSAGALAMTSSLLFVLSLAAGSHLSFLLPDPLTSLLSFSILFFLGLIRIFDHALQTRIQEHRWRDRMLHRSFHHLGFVLLIYARPQQANTDEREILSPSEALSLGLALSLDSIAAGISIAASPSLLPSAAILAFTVNFLALMSGSMLGRYFSNRTDLPFSILGGVLLLLLAVAHLLS